MSTLEPYEVFAIRYAETPRNARDNFMYADFHDGPDKLDFYIWLIQGNGKRFVVDLGYDHKGANRREREIKRLPSEGLQMLGVDPASIEDVIVTHMHYDHAGDFQSFPNARIHLQEREMIFATGPHMSSKKMRLAFDVEYVCDLVRAVYDERVNFINGAEELAPGLTVHHIGGHTDGLQVVRVWTEKGWLVLASDAVHLYANRNEENPFPIVYNLADMIKGYTTLGKLASSDELIIPGHDPQVLTRFPCPDKEFTGEIVRLDQGPVG